MTLEYEPAIAIYIQHIDQFKLSDFSEAGRLLGYLILYCEDASTITAFSTVENLMAKTKSEFSRILDQSLANSISPAVESIPEGTIDNLSRDYWSEVFDFYSCHSRDLFTGRHPIQDTIKQALSSGKTVFLLRPGSATNDWSVGIMKDRWYETGYVFLVNRPSDTHVTSGGFETDSKASNAIGPNLTVTPRSRALILAAERDLEQRIGGNSFKYCESRGVSFIYEGTNDFTFGVDIGKLCALRWALGSEWSCLTNPILPNVSSGTSTRSKAVIWEEGKKRCDWIKYALLRNVAKLQEQLSEPLDEVDYVAELANLQRRYGDFLQTLNIDDFMTGRLVGEWCALNWVNGRDWMPPRRFYDLLNATRRWRLLNGF